MRLFVPFAQILLDTCRQLYLGITGSYQALVLDNQLYWNSAISFSSFERHIDTTPGLGLLGRFTLQLEFGRVQHGAPAFPGFAVHKRSKQHDAVGYRDRQVNTLAGLQVFA